MPRKQKKYHYIYKTTNILNDKFYIGMHSTDNLNDGYVGSGKRLWYSINKHGKENHVCEILEFHQNRSSLRERETEIVNEKLLQDSLCMNIVHGGTGGFDHLNTPEGIINRSWTVGIWKQAGTNAWLKKYNEDDNFRYKELLRLQDMSKKGQLAYKGKFPHGSFFGKKHTCESKQKISAAKTGKCSGKQNSQFNTCWIYSLTKKKNIKIKIEDLSDYIKLGWIKGRKMKFT